MTGVIQGVKEVGGRRSRSGGEKKKRRKKTFKASIDDDNGKEGLIKRVWGVGPKGKKKGGRT